MLDVLFKENTFYLYGFCSSGADTKHNGTDLSFLRDAQRTSVLVGGSRKASRDLTTMYLVIDTGHHLQSPMRKQLEHHSQFLPVACGARKQPQCRAGREHQYTKITAVPRVRIS